MAVSGYDPSIWQDMSRLGSPFIHLTEWKGMNPPPPCQTPSESPVERKTFCRINTTVLVQMIKDAVQHWTTGQVQAWWDKWTGQTKVCIQNANSLVIYSSIRSVCPSCDHCWLGKIFTRAQLPQGQSQLLSQEPSYRNLFDLSKQNRKKTSSTLYPFRLNWFIAYPKTSACSANHHKHRDISMAWTRPRAHPPPHRHHQCPPTGAN